MTPIEDTGYPRLAGDLSPSQLREFYTVTTDELTLAQTMTVQAKAQLCCLIQLKTFQCLGHRINVAGVSRSIIEHIAQSSDIAVVLSDRELKAYHSSSARREHMTKILDHMGVRRCDATSREWLATVAEKAAEIRHYPRDIINILIESLGKHRTELPPFDVLDTIATAAHRRVVDRYFEGVNRLLTPEIRKVIDVMLQPTVGEEKSAWNTLKREPKAPTPRNVRDHLQHVMLLQQLAEKIPALGIPAPKLKHFREQARRLDVKEIREYKPNSRYALAAIFIRAQFASTLDDAAEILVRQVHAMENTAQHRLAEHNTAHTERAERLVQQLKDMLEALVLKGSATQRLKAVESSLETDAGQLIEECSEHLAYANGNFRPFMLKPFNYLRPTMLRTLQVLQLKSATDDTTMERMIDVVLSLQSRRTGEHVHPEEIGIDMAKDLSWLNAEWRKLVIEKSPAFGTPVIHRRYFELAVMYQLRDELKNGDLFVPRGEKFDDFRESLVDNATLDLELPEFAETSSFPIDGKQFTLQLQQELTRVARAVDARLPVNEHVEIVDGMVCLTKLKRAPLAEGVEQLDLMINERLVPTSIVDVIVETVKWLHLEKHFKPLSGEQPKLDDLLRRVVTTIFCYGCNLGPTQTARSIRHFTRRQIAWLDLKFVTEDTILSAVEDVINAYNRFELPTCWGAGTSASADGKQWRMYDQNLVSQYHIRYGGYGGIGYYHVSDKYIALYSRFISCSAYEAHYILDGLMENNSDVKPLNLHGDTHAQNYVVFGMAHLLGINLMPRIRQLKKLNMFRPARNTKYKHLNAVFAGLVDWALIERHWREMLRLAVSVKLGKVSASTILRRFGNTNHKNKLFYAVVELGKAVRTIFLLRYIDEVELRRMISAATNKSEEFNAFLSWVFFGNMGVIEENVRHEQQKLVRYQHLVANLVIFHNVEQMTRVVSDLQASGTEITREMLAGLAPYRTAHINRFGDYTIDVGQDVPTPEFERKILPPAPPK